LSAVDLDPIGSRMLDSIKATLMKVLGQESAQAVEFYVDKHLALKDPGAFEQALTDFLGSQAGTLIIDAIKADLRKENAKAGMPEPVSRFLSHQIQSAGNKPPVGPARTQAPKLSGVHFERFAKAAKLAMERGISFKDLVTEGLVSSQGETCGYATLACLGRKSLDDPEAFAMRVASIFSLEGITILDSLTAYCEARASGRPVTVF
jgi:hypothetical protein